MAVTAEQKRERDAVIGVRQAVPVARMPQSYRADGNTYGKLWVKHKGGKP